MIFDQRPQRGSIFRIAGFTLVICCPFVSSFDVYQHASAVQPPNAVQPPSAVQPPDATPAAPEPPAETADPASLYSPRPERSLQYWADQLSHERFLRRQSARQHLVEGGDEAVDVLRQLLDRGDLETIENAISVLAKIAQKEPPWRTDGALACLETLAQNSFGSKAALAKSAIDSFAESRGQEAKLQLSDSGIDVGTETVALGSRSSPRMIVRIGQQWDGDVKKLAWLKWLDRVDFAVIEGPIANPELIQAVVGAVISMPDLGTLVMAEFPLTVPCVRELQRYPRFEAVEIRYIRLDDALLDELTKVAIRESLHLLGTGVADDRLERLRNQLPGLEITHRRGGFLGVMCQSINDNQCQVSQVTLGSGADEAGLAAGDIITRIDDVKITRFDDLQQQINTHIPGEAIAIRFRRGLEVIDTVATLKKLQDR